MIAKRHQQHMRQERLSVPADVHAAERISPHGPSPLAPSARAYAPALLERVRPDSGPPGRDSNHAECSAARSGSRSWSSIHPSSRVNGTLISLTTAFHGGRSSAPRRRLQRRRVWMTSATAPVRPAKVGSDAINLAWRPVLLIRYIYSRGVTASRIGVQ